MPKLAHARVHNRNAGPAPLPSRQVCGVIFWVTPGKRLEPLIQRRIRGVRKVIQQVMSKVAPAKLAYELLRIRNDTGRTTAGSLRFSQGHQPERRYLTKMQRSRQP